MADIIHSVGKRDIADLLSDITLHQLSVALFPKNRKKTESRSVALLAYYSFSLNTTSLQSSVKKLCPRLSSKGRVGEATQTISFLLALCSRKQINGYTNKKQGNHPSLIIV